MSGGDLDWHVTPERGSPWALRVMRTLGSRAPDRAVDPLIWLIALYFTLFPGPTARAASTHYLRAVLGREPGFRHRHEHVRTFARVIFDRVRLLVNGLEGFDIRIHGQEVVRRCAERDQPCILLGAHFGSFEVMRALDRSLPGLKVRYLMYEAHADKTAGMLAEINPEVAAQIISLSDGPEAMLAVREALENRHSVAFLGDRMPVNNLRAEIEVDFLGGMIRLPRAPYVSAMLARVPLILFFSPMIGRRTYDISFTEIYDGKSVPRAERDAFCHALARHYAQELAAMCRRYPYNWFNFFDVWSGADVSGAAA